MALFKYFKIEKCVKEDNSLGNSNVCKAQANLWHKPCLPHWRIYAINHRIKPMVETIMDRDHDARYVWEGKDSYGS